MAISDIPKKQKVESAARPVDQAVRGAIAKGNLTALRRALSDGGRMPQVQSRQHPLFAYLAGLASPETPKTWAMISFLLEKGMPAEWSVGASREDIKRLAKSVSEPFQATLLKHHNNYLPHEHQTDMGASLVERLSNAGQHQAALQLVEHLPATLDGLVGRNRNSRTLPLEGLMLAGNWSAATRLFDRIVAEIPLATLPGRFWPRIEGAMVRQIRDPDPVAQALLDRIATARVDLLAADDRHRIQDHRLRTTVSHLDPRSLDRYLTWFPEDLDRLRRAADQPAPSLWTCLLTRACILGPQEPLWQSLLAEPAIAAQLNRPVDGIKLRTRRVANLVPDRWRAAPLPASPLDMMVLTIDRNHYLRDEAGADEDEDPASPSERSRRRNRQWSATIDDLMERGARPGFLRATEGFRSTYAELWSRRAHDLNSERPPTAFWRTHPVLAQPSPHTGRSPIHDARGTLEEWNYWRDAGFAPDARDHHGAMAFAAPLMRNLSRIDSNLRDYVRAVGEFTNEVPSRWDERGTRGLSVRDLACAHPTLFSVLKASKQEPGKQGQRAAIWGAQADILSDLIFDRTHTTDQTPSGWTLAGLARSRMGQLKKDDVRLGRLRSMIARLGKGASVDPPNEPGAFLRNMLMTNRDRWSQVSTAAGLQNAAEWGTAAAWSPTQLRRLLPVLTSHLEALPQAMPADLASRALLMLLDPAEWVGLREINPVFGTPRFAATAELLFSRAEPDPSIYQAWQRAVGSLSSEQQEMLDSDLAQTSVPARIQALALEHATAPASGRGRGGVRL